MISKIVSAFFLLVVVIQAAYADAVCPPAEEIRPCVCYGAANLLCKGIFNTDELRNVFVRSSIRDYSLVEITDSSLQFLPIEMFHNFHTSYLFISNSSLITLFGEPTPVNELKVLTVANSTLPALQWNFLQGMKSLEILIFTNTRLSIKNDFKAFIESPRALQNIVFMDADLRNVENGAFSNLESLRSIDLSWNKISRVERNWFPEGSAINEIDLTYNRITVLPDGFFSTMPNVKYIFLRDNQLTNFTLNVFGGQIPQKMEIDLSDNPIPCDCRIYWMLEAMEAGTTFRGTCLRGDLKKNLSELTARDFYCPNH